VILKGSTKVVHCKKSDYDVHIGRPSKWGNPFSHKSGTRAVHKVASRSEAIRRYRAWVQKQPKLMNALHELRGKTLGCWCKPYACHGDVLAKLADANERGNQMQIIGIGGVPASGKSTLMKEVLAELGVCGSDKLEYGLLKGRYFKEPKVILLGDYAKDEMYGGTDRLSFAAQPHTQQMIDELHVQPEWNRHTILFEGDRLFNASFIEFCEERIDCHWLLLTIPRSVQRKRLCRRVQEDFEHFADDRLDPISTPSQDDIGVDKTWLKSRATKYKTLGERKHVICISGCQKQGLNERLTEKILQKIRGYALAKP